MTLKTIIAALVTLAESWLPNTSLLNDVKDAVLALLNLKNLAPHNPFVEVAFHYATNAENGLEGLQSSGYAIAGAKEINGKTYSVIVIENGTEAAKNFGL